MKQKILFVVCLLFGLMFINAGLNKFFNYMPVPKEMPEKMMKMAGAFMEIGWLFPLVGVFEIIGGLLFIIPRTRALGAIILLPILVGILLTTIAAAPSALAIPLILLAIELFVIYDNREKYLHLVR
jgi:uncharacterized membrane protein YphA (DoxX/SURF4 family)